MHPLEKEEKKRKMTEVIDIGTMIKDIIKVRLKIRKKNPKERNMIDVGNVTLPVSSEEKNDTLADIVIFKER